MFSLGFWHPKERVAWPLSVGESRGKKLTSQAEDTSLEALRSRIQLVDPVCVNKKQSALLASSAYREGP